MTVASTRADHAAAALHRRRTLILLLLSIADLVMVLDFSVVNVALPAIQQALGFTPEGLQWIISAYALIFAGTLLLGGRAADLFGQRRIFLWGLVIFTLASLLCGLAISPVLLIAARGLQGLGAALVAPAVLSIIMTHFPEGTERNRAFAVIGMISSLGFSAGMIAGGVLTEFLGWRSIFFVNVPIGLPLAIATPLLIRAGPPPAHSHRHDFGGAVTVTAGLMLLIYAISVAPAAGLGGRITLLTAAGGIALLVLFLVIESIVPEPLVPLRVFRQRRLLGANVLSFLIGSSLAPLIFLLSLYLQDIQAYSTLVTGLAFLPMGAVGLALSRLTPFLIGRFGARLVIAGGMAAYAAGLLLCGGLAADSTYWAGVLPAMVVVSTGFMAAMMGTIVAATTGVDPGEQGLASGLVNTTNQIGAGIGVAAFIALASTQAAALAGQGLAQREALLQGFGPAFFAMAGTCVIGILAALWLLPADRSRDLAMAAE